MQSTLIVLEGTPLHTKDGHITRNFGPRLLRSNGYMDLDATWYGGTSAQATLCYIRTQLPLKKGHTKPRILANGFCGQTAGWIKMPVGIRRDAST